MRHAVTAAPFVLAAALTACAPPGQGGDVSRKPHTPRRDPGTRPAPPVLYPGPPGEEPSDLYTVHVNGRPAFVCAARVSASPVNRPWPGHQRPLDQTEPAAFACWDAAGPTDVRVVSRRPVRKVTVRPLRLGIRPEVAGDTIAFALPGPGQVVVEVNGIHHALHLFVNPPEDDAPDPGAPGVRYFGPGVHRPGRITLRSGETAYIAGGAVVHGVIHAADAENVRVRGRGILDASTIKRKQERNILWFDRCRDVSVSGIVLRDPHVWAAKPTRCDGVRFDNVKLVGCWRYNSDGFDFVDCRDVRVAHCFVRSFDDSIVLKSFHGREIRDVLVERCVVWTDWGVSLGITYETRTDRIRDVVFRDCDILHNIACRGALTINPSDRAEISDVTFEDIRVEDARSGLIELVVERTRYGKDPRRGHIRGVRFRDIAVTGGPFTRSILRGFDEDHLVRDVAIEGLSIHGRPIASPAAGRFRIGPHAKDIRFAAEPDSRE